MYYKIVARALYTKVSSASHSGVSNEGITWRTLALGTIMPSGVLAQGIDHSWQQMQRLLTEDEYV